MLTGPVIPKSITLQPASTISCAGATYIFAFYQVFGVKVLGVGESDSVGDLFVELFAELAANVLGFGGS
jgi:NADPH:quinone reductase-like Zn-dependent oxidoreductase